MLAALSSADPITWIEILVKALAYAATMLAAGGVLVAFALASLSEDGRTALRRLTGVAALVAALFSAMRLPVRASFLMGGGWDGALDPAILALVADSPLGTSVAVRLVGLALILFVMMPARLGRWLALAGVLLVAVSFALRGHALSEPRLVLGGLITLHILGLSFWVGGLAPLARAGRQDTPTRAGALAQEFGTRALWIVGALIAAGVGMLALLDALTPKALSTLYGQMILVKLAVFAGLFGLAALNKLSLTPALMAARSGAGGRLRRSILAEAFLIGAILVTTATLTTLATPPN